MLWLLTLVTTGVLLLIAGFVREISKTPTAARPAALTKTAHAARHATASPALRQKAPPTSRGREITDAYTGLSYQLLSSPWRRGCPDSLNTPMFSWSAGEHAVAGMVSGSPWYGDACSGLLQHQFQYSAPGDLAPTAMSLAGAMDAAYHSGLEHYRTLEDSSAMLVSGHQAWEVTFQISYPNAAAQGLAFSSEAGAVVVVDRSAGQAPAVFYASVPNNLGTSDVATLVSSLQLNS